jgi:hypothetical protein
MKARPRRKGWRMPKSKCRSQTSSGHSETLWTETVDAGESTQEEEIDRLLLSSLRFWEVEHDLIEERVEQIGSRAGGGVADFGIRQPTEWQHIGN